MTVVDYDLGYYEGVRNAYRLFLGVQMGHDLEEVLKIVLGEMENARAIHLRTKEEYE